MRQDSFSPNYRIFLYHSYFCAALGLFFYFSCIYISFILTTGI